MFAMDNGGYFNNFDLSKHEKYVTLPKLVDLGWVYQEGKANKVNKYRRLWLNEGCAPVETIIEKKDLESLDHFKAFLLASCEASALSHKDSINSGKRSEYSKRENVRSVVNWKNSGVSQANSTTKIRQANSTKVTGRVFRKELHKLMGLSEPTITRWRRLSKKLGYNSYVQNKVNLSQKKVFTDYEKVLYDCGSFYYNKKGEMMANDTKVTSTIKVFLHKDYSKKGNFFKLSKENLTKKTFKSGSSASVLSAYVDGSSSFTKLNENSNAGWGFVVFNERDEIIHQDYGHCTNKTSQSSEIIAAKKALTWLQENRKKDNYCILNSDSLYTLNNFKNIGKFNIPQRHRNLLEGCEDLSNDISLRKSNNSGKCQLHNFAHKLANNGRKNN